MKAIIVLVILASRFFFAAIGEKKPSAAQLAKAREIFKERCARCHGVDGRGQTELGSRLHVPDFTDETWPKPNVNDDELASTIRTGRDEMPAFAKKLTREETNHLVAFIRGLKEQSDKR